MSTINTLLISSEFGEYSDYNLYLFSLYLQLVN